MDFLTTFQTKKKKSPTNFLFVRNSYLTPDLAVLLKYRLRAKCFKNLMTPQKFSHRNHPNQISTPLILNIKLTLLLLNLIEIKKRRQKKISFFFCDYTDTHTKKKSTNYHSFFEIQFLFHLYIIWFHHFAISHHLLLLSTKIVIAILFNFFLWLFCVTCQK